MMSCFLGRSTRRDSPVARRVDLNSKELCPPTPSHATNRCMKKRPQPTSRAIESQTNTRSGTPALRSDRTRPISKLRTEHRRKSTRPCSAPSPFKKAYNRLRACTAVPVAAWRPIFRIIHSGVEMWRSGDNSKKVSLRQLRRLVRLTTKEPK